MRTTILMLNFAIIMCATFTLVEPATAFTCTHDRELCKNMEPQNTYDESGSCSMYCKSLNLHMHKSFCHWNNDESRCACHCTRPDGYENMASDYFESSMNAVKMYCPECRESLQSEECLGCNLESYDDCFNTFHDKDHCERSRDNFFSEKCGSHCSTYDFNACIDCLGTEGRNACTLFKYNDGDICEALVTRQKARFESSRESS